MRSGQSTIQHFYFSILFFFAAVLLAGCDLIPEEDDFSTDNEVLSLEIAPLIKTLPKNAQLTLYTEAHFGDGTIKNVSSDARWFSTNPEVLSVNGNGTLTTHTEGVTTVSVSVGNQSISKEIHVNNATIESLQIETNSSVVRLNMDFTLSVFALFSDGSKLDVSRDITWFVSNNDISEDIDVVTRTFDNHFRSIAIGEGRIVANYNKDSISTELVVTVRDATLNSVRISLQRGTYTQGIPINLNVIGYYDDGSKLDISSQTTWSHQASDNALLITGNSLRPLLPGDYQLTAVAGNITRIIFITVQAASQQTIEVTSFEDDILQEDIYALRTYGIYDNGDVRDISNSVSWDSSDNKILEVSNVSQHAGEILGLVSGDARVIVSSGLSFVDATDITIRDEKLTSIDIVAPTQSIALGTSPRLQALGNYADGITRDITHLVSWSRLSVLNVDPVILLVKNSPANAGKIETLLTGDVEVQAKYRDQSDSISLTVHSLELQSISINETVDEIYSSDKFTLTVTGTYDENTSQDISELVTWQSSNPALLEVSNYPDTRGKLTIVSDQSGLATITAQVGAMAVDIPININNATVSTIDIEQPVQIPSVGEKFTLRALATYSDNRTKDITEKVYWSTDANNVKVSNAPGTKGNMTANVAGKFSVTVAYAGQLTRVEQTVEVSVNE